ncbi:uncharacterized protein HKW66_Vig0080640 [Vigna angularis]|uniref:RRM domain-containing protein n=1 Tax=Phaseolus angularis TaxID=3914 RepID=A0A8T0KIH3_PHAAN|nr:uncharacterized protein HKW66_Vig0080640 [Vigna angularis]
MRHQPPQQRLRLNKNRFLPSKIIGGGDYTGIQSAEDSRLKDELSNEQAAKRLKFGTMSDVAILASPPQSWDTKDVLKKHFSPFGELSFVELEDVQINDNSQQEAHITFTTRWAAERAFINDLDDHSKEELGNSMDQEVIESDDENKNCETRNGLELVEMEPNEDPQSTTKVSSPKQSLEGSVC